MNASDTVELEYRKRIDAMTIAERVHRAEVLADLAVLWGVGPAVAQLLRSFDLVFPVFLLFLILLARVTLRNQWAAFGAITFLWSALIACRAWTSSSISRSSFRSSW